MENEMSKIKRTEYLRADARGALEGNYSAVIPSHILFLVLKAFLLYGSGGFINTLSSVGSFLIAEVITYLSMIIVEVLNFGLNAIYLKMVCRHKFGSMDIFMGFKKEYKNVAGIAIFFATVQFLCALPYEILSMFSLKSENMILFSITMLSLAVGIVVSYVIRLHYSQAYFVLLDFPNKTAKEALSMSKWLMKGSLVRRFYLEVGFVPLYLLSVFTCGLGMIWLFPYLHTTFVEFYLNLTDAKS
mgnify:CR=1 FL=1